MHTQTHIMYSFFCKDVCIKRLTYDIYVYMGHGGNYRRAIRCRRAVRVKSQLKSHKRFANAFLTYCQLVDNARLYCTNALEGPPKVHHLYIYYTFFLADYMIVMMMMMIWFCELKLIGWKEKDKTLLVDPDEIDCLKRVGMLNEEAESIYELYKNPNPACEAGSIWKDIVLSPSRLNIQQELKYTIQKVERSKSYVQ